MLSITRIIKLFVAVAVVAGMSGCKSSQNNLTYFYDLEGMQSGTLQAEIPQLHIVPDDVLSITVNSLYPEATAIYNMPLINPSVRTSVEVNATPSQQTYIVDSKGDINFPVLGTMHVEGMTTEQLAEYITKRISDDVKDPYVRVELLSFKVQVLGEVMKPGTVKVEGERLTVLDALASVGDMTPYGMRDNVLLIRQENGSNEYYRLNLNSSEILTSPLYYLKQNDVIIVQPNDIRKANSRYNQDNAYKLSVISTIVSAASVVASLAIALAVK